jgi:hypothetical protein
MKADELSGYVARFWPFGRQPRVWEGGDHYIVQTRVDTTADGRLAYGRLVSLEERTVGPEVPIDSIAAHMPDAHFRRFTGDPGPVLDLLLATVKAEESVEKSDPPGKAEPP